MPNRWQLIIWGNVGILYWYIYASLGLDELSRNALMKLIVVIFTYLVLVYILIYDRFDTWVCWAFILQWASYKMHKIAGCACAGSPLPRISDPDMHHGTCVTHVPWCMPRRLTSGFLWSWWRGKRSRHSRRMYNPQFGVSGKRPVVPVPYICGTICSQFYDRRYLCTSWIFRHHQEQYWLHLLLFCNYWWL